MDCIEKHIVSFLQKYNLTNSDLTYLVGFSGGYDSMCLLHALRKVSQNKIIAIHLNHNWRGEESDLEEQNCAEFCEKIGVEFYTEGINVAQTETAAREARYDFFEHCSKKFKSNVIFTAHNKNDNAETIIQRICRGTGVSGLAGIAPKRGIFYRPLLEVERNAIENYCKENNLKPNNDSSNADTIHKRNLIRHEILPKMKEINPDVINAICSLGQIAAEETEILKNLAELKDNKIKTVEYFSLPESLQKRVLYEIITPLVPQDYDRERILTVWNFIKENCNSKSGKTVSVTTGWWIFVSDKIIELIQKTNPKEVNIKINGIGEFSDDNFIVNVEKVDDKYNCENGIIVDLSGFDLNFELRNRQDGDIICIGGTKKLKKYLNEKKIPNHEKDNLIFLAQGKEILWAVGLGVSDKIKVKTKATHKIEVRKNESTFH